MALVVTHSGRKPGGGGSIGYKQSEWTVTVPWQILTDGTDRDINSGQIATWTGTPTVQGVAKPQVGDLLDSTSGMVLKTIDPQQNGSEFIEWNLTLNYGYITAESSGGGGGGGAAFGEINPVSRPPVVRRFTTEVVEAIESLPTDVPGDEHPLVWPNGRPMVPLPTRTYYMPTLYVQQFEPSFSNAAASSVVGSVNSTQFCGYPARSVLCIKMDGDLVFWQNGQATQTCAQTTYQFIHNRHLWSPMRILSRDFFEKVNNSIRPIVMNGGLVQEPWPIDLNGKMVPADNIANGDAANEPGLSLRYHYTDIRMVQFDFNLLPLPYQYL